MSYYQLKQFLSCTCANIVLSRFFSFYLQGFSIKMKLFAIDAQLLSPKVYMCTIRSVHALTKLYTFSLEMSPHKKMTKNWDFY